MCLPLTGAEKKPGTVLWEIKTGRGVYSSPAFLFLCPAFGAAPDQAKEPGDVARLVVSTKPFKPFAYKRDGSWVGFSIDLWEEIAQQLSVETEWLGTRSVSELLDTVRDENASIAVAGLSITSEREEYIDFTHPFYESGLQILVPATGTSEDSFFTTVKTLGPTLLRILALLGLLTLLVSHIVWFIERKKNPDMFPRSYLAGIGEAFWWSAVTMTTVGYGDLVPRSMIGRAIALIWMFSGIIFIAYFTANVTSALTIQRLEGTIQGPSDLPGKRVGTIRGSTASTWLYGNAIRVEEFEQIDEAFARLEAGEIEAIVYDSPVLLYHASHEGAGVVSVVGPVFQKQSYGFALPHESPLRERINNILLKLREDGTYQKLHFKWFGR
jgi:ABC-type amino acid transport substrate-binding protein